MAAKVFLRRKLKAFVFGIFKGAECVLHISSISGVILGSFFHKARSSVGIRFKSWKSAHVAPTNRHSRIAGYIIFSSMELTIGTKTRFSSIF